MRSRAQTIAIILSKYKKKMGKRGKLTLAMKTNETATPTSPDPIKTDTRLAAIWERASKIEMDLDNLRKVIEQPSSMRNRGAQQYANERMPGLLAERNALIAESVPLEAEYAKHRWPRFFLVTNGNGHVHSSRQCVTTYPKTRWAWLPQLSGKSEQTAVHEHGEKMCTICFPSAPTMEGWGKVAKQTAEKRAAKADIKAEKELAAKAKLLDPENKRSGTIRDAQWRLKADLEQLPFVKRDLLTAPPERKQWHLDKIAELEARTRSVAAALAKRLGVDADTLHAEAVKKALKVTKRYLP
jgi:hypothetical protein